MIETRSKAEEIVFDGEDTAFEFNLDVEYVEGLDKVESRVEERMNGIIKEELDRVCFRCGFDKLKSGEDYYCPKCEE